MHLACMRIPAHARTPQVYCGRAVWSAGLKRKGFEVYFLDNDRSVVEPSFAVAPDEFCWNGLDEDHFIHLDFLDFAMAMLDRKIEV